MGEFVSRPKIMDEMLRPHRIFQLFVPDCCLKTINANVTFIDVLASEINPQRCFRTEPPSSDQAIEKGTMIVHDRCGVVIFIRR